MGNLREQIFLRAMNDSLDRLRNDMCQKYKPKKESRFFTGGITYDIGQARLVDDGAQFEMSSKIPQEIMPKKGMNQKYFRKVRDVMNKCSKKPLDVRMENIIRSANVNELKERDYVKCVFQYSNRELYTEEEVNRIVKAVSAGKMELPEIHGITTLPGRAVIHQLRENIYRGAQENINEIIKANTAVMKVFAEEAKKVRAESGNGGKPAPRKKASASAPAIQKTAKKRKRAK